MNRNGDKRMEWTGWANGSPSKTGAGYGLRVPAENRRTFFSRKWKSVTLMLETRGKVEEVHANLTSTFWEGCPELRGKAIGGWLQRNNLAPWPKGKPPKVKAVPVGSRRFRVHSE